MARRPPDRPRVPPRSPQKRPEAPTTEADFDGDTVPDLVTTNNRSSDVSVLLGNGDGSFQTAVFFAAGASPRSVAVADLDGDSVPDLVTANTAFNPPLWAATT